MRIIYSYQREFPPNLGYTLAIPSTEPVLAPGDGTISFIKSAASGWRFRNPASARTIAISIDHGEGVKTYVAGLAAGSVTSPQVTRGQVLGYSAAGEIFLAVEIDRTFVNPASVNEFFAPRDGEIFYQQPNFISQAPTIVKQSLSAIADIFYNSLSYFLPSPAPLILFNIDFNGNGSKNGLAAVGSGDDDYWNVYDPINFFTSAYGCAYFYPTPTFGAMFNAPMLVPLKDYRQRSSKVFLERVAPLSAVSGVAAGWDEMLGTWIGGYSGMTPYVNTFRLRGLPSGDYTLYLYSDQGTTPNVSYFQATVGGTTLTGNTNPTGALSFLENDNYVAFDLSLGYRSVVEITTSGYLAGLQMRRIIV